MKPRFPIVIPTKGRHDTRLTIKMFDELGAPYTIFVEEQELELYAQYVARDRIHVLPHRDKGVTVTRNYIWDWASAQGFEYYWTFDDNISSIHRFERNMIIRCADPTPLYVIEDFALRYENLPMCGMNYEFFVKFRFQIPPFILNTRIYSNMLIKTDAKDASGAPLRFKTFFNEDTDISLRILKARQCTVLFNAFLVSKKQTMTMAGGNSEYYAQTDKRREFVQELLDAHPDCVQHIERWGRNHHWVNYKKFRHPLKRKPDVKIPIGVNEFGMQLQEKTKDGNWVDLNLDAA